VCTCSQAWTVPNGVGCNAGALGDLDSPLRLAAVYAEVTGRH
jgi:hypothetical protein